MPGCCLAAAAAAGVQLHRRGALHPHGAGGVAGQQSAAGKWLDRQGEVLQWYARGSGAGTEAAGLIASAPAKPGRVLLRLQGSSWAKVFQLHEEERSSAAGCRRLRSHQASCIEQAACLRVVCSAVGERAAGRPGASLGGLGLPGGAGRALGEVSARLHSHAVLGLYVYMHMPPQLRASVGYRGCCGAVTLN